MKPNQALSARAMAAALLAHILGEGKTLDEAMHAAPLKGNENDQKFARAMVLTVLRHLGQIDILIARHLVKALPGKRLAVMNALRLGVAQLLLLDTPVHAALHETVSVLKGGKDAGLAGLVNAVLQKIAREKPELPDVRCNVPLFFEKRWVEAYGREALKAIATVASTRPPLDIAAKQAIDGATRMDRLIQRLPSDHASVETLPGYEAGEFFIQDVAASYPARLLGNVAGKRVLDVCAAPGGKAAQLAWAGADVTALDRSPTRMRVLDTNMARLKLNVATVTADALEWDPAEPFDAVLLDAPCSATGTWRRHPEVLALVKPEDIAELAELQRKLLVRAWNWLKPGGVLVYCVCSLEPEEGEEQATWFQAEMNAQILPIDSATEIPITCINSKGYLRTLPGYAQDAGGMDGFFAVAFRKA